MKIKEIEWLYPNYSEASVLLIKRVFLSVNDLSASRKQVTTPQFNAVNENNFASSNIFQAIFSFKLKPV